MEALKYTSAFRKNLKIKCSKIYGSLSRMILIILYYWSQKCILILVWKHSLKTKTVLIWFQIFADSEKKFQEKIIGLRIVYNLHIWNDITVYTLTREFTINDYLYKYWIKFVKHLKISADVFQYQLTFSSYLYVKSPQKNWYLSIGMRKNSEFPNRLSQRAKHSKIDLLDFLSCHYQQYGYFKHASFPTLFSIYKYLLTMNEPGASVNVV
jgi:hypothetical protein